MRGRGRLIAAALAAAVAASGAAAVVVAAGGATGCTLPGDGASAAPASPASPGGPPGADMPAPSRVEPAPDEAPAVEPDEVVVPGGVAVPGDVVAPDEVAPPDAEPPGGAEPAAKGEPAALRGIVAAHNRVRAKHCAPPLSWSPELARVAQRWANHLRDAGCSFGHSGSQYGENLAAATEGTLDNDGAVAMWYDEIAKYDFRRPGFSMETGHFTQVVWAGTERVGCAISSCKGYRIWVCNYDPAGNVETMYESNVLPTTCKRRAR